MELSLKEARALITQSQFLGEQKLLSAEEALETLGYIQIDTISVVERAHHHTIWNRFREYNPKDGIYRLLKERKAFEYWSHAASYLPIEDFRFSLPRMQAFATGERHWFEKDLQLMNYVLDRIKNEGPLGSSDFEHPKGGSGWFDWKPTKKALELLFMEGKLMVSERRGFQKVYDLAENVLPSHVNTTSPTLEECAEHLVLRTLKSQGIATLNQISYLRRKAKAGIDAAMKKLVSEGRIEEVRVEGQNEKYFALPNYEPANDERSLVHILSPFDNLLIQRQRTKSLFDYDYLIECYVPEEKRQFGYFCLPVLFGTELVGRIDAKAHRKEKVLSVKNVFLEKDLENAEELIESLDKALQEFAEFNGCNEYEINETEQLH